MGCSCGYGVLFLNWRTHRGYHHDLYCENGTIKTVNGHLGNVVQNAVFPPLPLKVLIASHSWRFEMTLSSSRTADFTYKCWLLPSRICELLSVAAMLVFLTLGLLLLNFCWWRFLLLHRCLPCLLLMAIAGCRFLRTTFANYNVVSLAASTADVWGTTTGSVMLFQAKKTATTLH